MLPMMLRLKIRSRESRGVNLYVPLLLIYLLLLPFVLLVLPFVLIWIVLPHKDEEGKPVRYSLKIIPALLSLFCAARGTEIEVNDKRSEVLLKLI